MEETWKQIPGFNKYEISTLGRVRHIKHLHILKYTYPRNGYPQVGLSRSEKYAGRVSKCVHHLMVLTFIGKLVKGAEINHKDGNKSNASLDNLEIFHNKKEHMKLHRKRKWRLCHCGKEVAPHRKYCSSECRKAATWVERKCVVCGRTITLRKSQIKRSLKDPRYHNAGQYCSKECYGTTRAGMPNLHHFKYKRECSFDLFPRSLPTATAVNE